ncbi:MAG: DUF3276 family protein [Treponema sp.]|nr:DUF3276 family protein [Treponema sp.]
MGIRGEVYSTSLILPNRTYFFNVKENRVGDLYLNIVESKNREGSGFERQSVIVFADDLPAFLGDFDKALKALEKSVREQKRSPRKNVRGESGAREEHQSREERGQGGKPYRKKTKTGRGDETSGGERRRVVVKKR